MITSQKWFQVLVLPFLFSIIGVFARRLGRHEHDKTPSRNDWAVATTVILMALGVMATDVRSLTDPNQLVSVFLWLLGALCLLFLSVDHDRFRSWERDKEGKPNGHKRIFIGIVVPDLISIAAFVSYRFDTWGMK